MRWQRSALVAALGSLLAAGMAGVGVQAAPARAAAPTPQVIWVDPAHGNDSRTGATAVTALRTLTAAWNRIPQSRLLSRPVNIMLKAGTIADTAAPNYWEHRWGTAAAPISIVSADGPNLAVLPSINMYDVRNLLLAGVTVRSEFDPFHCERCSFIELRRVALVGVGNPALDQGPHEGAKFNQSDHIRIVDSYLSGATDNSLDMVAVQHAYIGRNTIANSIDWCAYAKGGSTDVEFDSNHVHHCGTGGITLGQGTGLQFMVAPWTNYEVYGSRVVNNVLHDIEGAAIGVNGGYNALVADNTAYRTGSRDHLLEVAFGERSCDGEGEDDAICAGLRTAGGWGPRAAGGDPTPIGSHRVALVDNLLYNPAGIRSLWSQFAVYGPRDGGDGGPPATDDDGLVIRGNVIWNGPADLDLGLGGDQGCADGNPTCTPDLVRAQNAINTVQPPVRVLAGVLPVPAGAIGAGTGAGLPLPTFSWDGVPATRGVPAVAMPAAITRDRAGVTRAGRPWRPGAYLGDAPVSSLRVYATGPGSIAVRSGGTLSGKGGWVGALSGDWVELSAHPTAGKRFLRWSGPCAGQGATCVVHPATAAPPAISAQFQ